MLNRGQLRACFELVAHRPDTGASPAYVATTLRLDLREVQEALMLLAGAGLLVNGGKPWTYKTATLIRDFNKGQAGEMFDAVFKG